MPSFNRVILVGNLTRDTELTVTSSGSSVCKFGLAINRKMKDKEQVSFIDCTAFGKTGELMARHLHKGSPVLVEGRIQQGRWTDKEGKARSKVEVVVENFTFIGVKGGGEVGSASDPVPTPGMHDNVPPDDDIPF